MAQVSFSNIFKSTAANQGEESQSFAGSQLSGATNIKFVSQDPTQVQFSGNNVPGDLTYTLGGVNYSVPGIVSRLFKSGNTYEGFYFVDSGSDYTMTSQEVTSAYILVWPGRVSAFPTSPGTYSTSSDPVDSALNSLLTAQPTLVGITQNEADLTLDVNQTVLYTFTFSNDIDAATFTSADITNTGTAGVTIGTITETSPGVFTVQVTGTSAGTVNLAIPAGAVITSPTGYSLNTGSQINDDQTLNVVAAAAAPTITGVTAEDAATAAGSGDSSVVEGNPLRYTVSLSAAGTTATTFSLAASGTAAAADYGSYTFSNGVTYNATTGQVTVPAGVTSFTITVPTVDDTSIESPETLVLTVGGVPGTGNITDNDAPTITGVTAEDAATNPGSGDSSVVEGNPLRYTVSLSAAGTTPTTFSLAASGTAAAADYGSYTFSNGVTYNATTGQVTVPAGVTSFTITVPTVDDTSIESPETLVLTVGGVPGTGTITDNDAASIAGVTAEDAATSPGSGDSSVVEGNALRYTVSLTMAPTAPTTFSLAASGTAAAADYGSYTFSNGVTYDSATGQITVPAGVTSFTITVPTVDDTGIENTETLVLTVGGVPGTGTITDNDAPTISGVTAEDAATAPGSGDSSVVEGNPLRYTVSLSGAPIAPAEFTLAASGTAAAADYSAFTFSDGVTYDATTGKVTVPAGVTSFTITAPTVDDATVENTEALVLTIGGVPATGTITDNDVPPTPVITGVTAEDAATAPGSGDSAVVEGNPLRYSISLSSAPDAPMQFSLAASGTAAAADYGNYAFSNGVTYDPATGKITVPAGVSSFAITVPTVDDTKVEPTETLVLTVGGVAGTGTITDNDVIAVSKVTAEDAATPAGSGDSTVVEGQPLRYTIALSDTTLAPTELSLATGGSASPADYSAYTFSNGVTYNAATGKLTVPAGVSSFSITAPTVDDTASEPTETLGLTVGGVAATGTILDNDAIPVYFAPSSVLGDDRQLSLSGSAAKSVQFYVTTGAADDPLRLKAWFNPLTGDWFYGRSDVAPPYECYVEHPEVQLGVALPKGKGAFDVHTYVNAQGVTQVMSEAAAASLGLAAQGFHDLGDSYVFASLTGLPTV